HHLIQLAPNDPALYQRRGRAYAEVGFWDEAAADFARAVALQPAEITHWRRQALLFVARGDRDGYRRTCTLMNARFGKTKEAKTADLLAFTAALLPDSDIDAKQLVALSRSATETHLVNADYLETLGAALYRAGEYQSAVESLDEAVKHHDQGGSTWMRAF